MSREVDRILAARARRGSHRPEAVSLGAALLLHGLVALSALLAPRLQKPPEPLEFVPVQIIPAQALGVRRPAPPRPREPEPAAEEAPAPEPPAPEPEPQETAPAPEPAKPEPAREEAPVLPDEDGKERKKETRKPEPPKPQSPRTDRTETPRRPASEAKGEGKGGSEGPAGVAPGETGDQLGRRGASTGNPLGTSAFGSRIGVDNPDFTYGYYLDRLLSLIDANWQRPALGGDVRTVLFFRIERNGSVSELRVAESSGSRAFDLAAQRAVQNASPFPPLPRGYRQDSLGVNLIVY